MLNKKDGKRLLCAVFIVMLSVCFSGCIIHSEQVCECAADSLEAILARDTEKLEELSAVSEGELDYISSLSDDKAVDLITGLVTYEISDKDVYRDGFDIVCDVKLLIPDYKNVLLESNYVFDGFADRIMEVEETDYLPIELKLEFEKSGDRYRLSNGDDIVNEIYTDMAELVSHIADDSEETLACPIVYENDQITIRYKETADDGVHFLVRNNTDYRIDISAEDMSLNGQTVKIGERSDGEIIAEYGVFSGGLLISGERITRTYYIDINELIPKSNDNAEVMPGEVSTASGN